LHVATDPNRPTGMMFKGMTTDGTDPAVHYARKGSAASQLGRTDFDVAYFRGARVLHVTGVAAALSAANVDFAQHAMAEMIAADRQIPFDPNLRPSLWPSESTMVAHINALASRAHWVLPGLKEGTILTGFESPRDIADFYLDRGTELVVIGAGDGFAAGLISALLEGESIEDAVARGNRVGAFAIQVIGDMDGLPTRAQLGVAALAR
jgi:2-dehydro-3-deoxygluconokinase